MQLDCFPTLASNTGLNSPTTPPPFSCPSIGQVTPPLPALSIDGFSLLWDEVESFDILPLIKNLLGVEFDFTKSISMTVGVRWDYVYRGSLGALYMCRLTPDGFRYRLSIPGKVCSSVPLRLSLRFFEVVYSQNPDIICSRIDICIDDFSKKLTFENIAQALKEKNHSGFRTCQAINNYDSLNGWTIYLGSRQSEHMVRVYNKSAESLGRVNSIRWESEYKGEKSNAIFKSLALSLTPEHSIKLLKGYVLGKINFIHHIDKTLERCKMLDWWAEFVAYLNFERVQVLVDKVVTSIESKMNWFGKQVEKSLALISRALGSEGFQTFIDESLVSGTDRLRKYDEILLIEYLNSKLNIIDESMSLA